MKFSSPKKQRQEAFNSALFIDVATRENSYQTTGSDSLSELNEANMLGTDLLEALDDEEDNQ